MEIVILSIVLAVVIALYVTSWLPIALTSILIPPALVFLGLLEPSQALSGFSSSAVITIACMYVLSAGLQRTGVLEVVTFQLAHHSKGSVKRFMLLLFLVVPLASAFMNNTPVVVMMVPVVMAIGRDLNVKPSKLMIPLSYMAILGGACTLIGTSTNILVDEFYRKAMPESGGFSMFEFFPLGFVFVLAGIAFIYFIGWHILPERSSLSGMMPRGRTAKFVTEVVVDEGSNLQGKRVGSIFHKDSTVRLLEVVHDEEVVLAPGAADMTLEKGDSLLVEGASKAITEFLHGSGAALSSVVQDEDRVPTSSVEVQIGEAVVVPKSPFVGRRVADLALNRLYNVKVMAVQRRGRHHRYRIRNMHLRPGDVMLLQAGRQGFDALKNTEAVLIVENLEDAIVHKGRAFPALAIMAAVILLAVFTPLPIALLAMAGAGMMLLTGCLRPDQAFRSLDGSVLLLLAGAIPLGVAMQETGMAEKIVSAALALTGPEQPLLKLSLFYIITTVISQALSNNATAVLMAPLAITTAAAIGVDPKPFLMAIAFGASASFMSPIGYQTNAIVLGPGGYTFKDYLKIGAPLTMILWVLATLLIPVIWPF